MSDKEIERKRPVWHALSELFLDTELQSEDYCRIAQTLRGSGFDADQLRLILEQEVAPAFAFNLMDIAGEWTPWSEGEVADIVSRAARRSMPRRWLSARRHRKYLADEWAKIRPLLDV